VVLASGTLIPFVIRDIFLTRHEGRGSAWRSLRAKRTSGCREIACVGARGTLLLAELGDPRLPWSRFRRAFTGTAAGVWALSRSYATDCSTRAIPIGCGHAQPTGFDAGTRENAEGHRREP